MSDIMNLNELIEHLRGGLVVSCQAQAEEPLYGSSHMSAMAKAAVEAGAVGIRANGPEDIASIHATIDVPIIGLYKVDMSGFDVRITPSFQQALAVAEAGADIIALDATSRPRPAESVADLIKRIHQQIARPVLADVSTTEEGHIAVEAGADFLATTLSGYTSYSPSQPGPDFFLLEQLVKSFTSHGIPVLAEGRIGTPEQAARALKLGAHAVVVGSAITRPQWITARFVGALRKMSTR